MVFASPCIMSQRIDRVNQLLQREISHQLLQNYQRLAVKITISSVDTSSDLRKAHVYYSVLGDDATIGEAEKLFKKVGKDLQRRVSQFIVLKYFPKFEFIYDSSMKRGASLINLLDDLSEEDKTK